MSRVIPSGFPALDQAIGIGGYPRGRVVEIYGPEGAGKTELALRAVCEAQRLGGIAAFIDAERTLDLLYARSIGVDIEQLLVSQPDGGGQALEIVGALMRQRTTVIVVDSVAAFALNAHVDDRARLLSQALRKLTAAADRSRTTLIVIHRSETADGNALKFYASVRLDVRRIEGGKTRVKVVKNKCAPPFGAAEFDIREVST